MRYQSSRVIPATGPSRDELCLTTIPCPGCNSVVMLIVDRVNFETALSGVLIQKAFPAMPAAVRERLISGYCSTCWDQIFAADEEE